MPKPVPILLMTHSLGIGGSERQMAEVARSVDRERFEPHVACFHADGPRAEELRRSGVPILRLPVTSFASRTAVQGARTMLGYIREHGIQLVHAFDTPANIFGGIVGWLARRPAVLTSQRAHRSLTPPKQRPLLRLTDRLADGFVVNCEYMRRHMVEDEGIRPDRIQLCYNGIDAKVFKAGEAADHPYLVGGPIVIGVVCALRPEKGLGTLMLAFAGLPDVDARLLIVGSGPELPALQTQARLLGIADRTVFVPATADVAPWMRKIDIFVLPSLSEALSNSLMEAMACGCCAVASRVGGNPELIGNSERGFLFEAQDAQGLEAQLRRLVAEPELRQKLASAGSRFVHENFTIERSVQRMQEIYWLCIPKWRGNPSRVHQR